jgi:ribosome-binding factor A
MPYRPDKVAHQLKAEISDIISREVHDPRVGFVTITNVRVSPDLTHARVFVSVFGSALQQKESVAALNRAAGFIRREVGARLRLRKSPELAFSFDESVEQGARLTQLIEEANREATGDAPSDLAPDAAATGPQVEGGGPTSEK